jgi:hypothetical protein
MDQNRDWIVYQRNDGLWAKKKIDAEIASSVHATQEQAEKSARETLNRGRGKVLVVGLDGKIQSKDTFLQTVIQSLLRTKNTYS